MRTKRLTIHLVAALRVAWHTLGEDGIISVLLHAQQKRLAEIQG